MTSFTATATDAHTGQSGSASASFTVNARNIWLPAAGHAYFGAHTGPGLNNPTTYEALVGRQLAAYRNYYALSSGTFPTAQDKTLVAQGRIAALDLTPSYVGANPLVTYANVTSGAHDSQLVAIANAIASTSGPVFLSWTAEPEIAARAPLGTAADFIASWIHVHSTINAIAPQTVWCWDVSGTNAGAYYPGDQYVDWIAADPYDPTLAKGSPLATYQPFMTWLAAQSFGKGKPVGIFETGVDASATGSAGDIAEAAWINAVPAACQQLGISMWLWFNSSGTLGTTSIIAGSDAAAAMKNIGASSFFNQQG